MLIPPSSLTVAVAVRRTNLNSHLRWSFFAQAPLTLDELREEVFYLLYNGHGGFDGAFVYSMTRDERRWFVERLSKQITEEKEQHERNAAKMKADAKKT